MVFTKNVVMQSYSENNLSKKKKNLNLNCLWKKKFLIFFLANEKLQIIFKAFLTWKKSQRRILKIFYSNNFSKLLRKTSKKSYNTKLHRKYKILTK